MRQMRPATPAARAAAPKVILLHAESPAKPAVGSPCNGCGICCAAEPCPLGILLSRKLSGACAALAWRAEESRYACGALAAPSRWLPVLPRAWAARLVRRWIAAGQGCDADYQPEVAAPDTREVMRS